MIIKVETITKKTISDCLFITGSIVAAMTYLRVPGTPVGVGEVILFCWMVLSLFWCKPVCKEQRINNYKFFSVRFWLILSVSFAIGTIVNVLFFQYKNSIRDIAALFFEFLLVYVLCTRYAPERIQNVVNLISIFAVIWFGILLLIATLKLPFPLQLIYGGRRFCGGADNPNTLATLLICIPFVAIWNLRNTIFNINKVSSKKVIAFVFWIIILILSFKESYATDSDATKLSYILSIFAFVFFLMTSKMRDSVALFFIIAIFAIFIVVFFLLFDFAMPKAIDYFASYDHDSSRQTLWSNAFFKISESGGLGYGPGSFLDLATIINHWEAHNTILDFAMQGGLLLAATLIAVYIYGMFKLRYAPILAAGLFVLAVSSLAGYKARKPWFWIFMIYFFSFIHVKRRREVSIKLH